MYERGINGQSWPRLVSVHSFTKIYRAYTTLTYKIVIYKTLYCLHCLNTEFFTVQRNVDAVAARDEATSFISDVLSWETAAREQPCFSV